MFYIFVLRLKAAARGIFKLSLLVILVGFVMELSSKPSNVHIGLVLQLGAMLPAIYSFIWWLALFGVESLIEPADVEELEELGAKPAEAPRIVGYDY